MTVNNLSIFVLVFSVIRGTFLMIKALFWFTVGSLQWIAEQLEKRK